VPHEADLARRHSRRLPRDCGVGAGGPSANWDASGGNEWTVPLGIGLVRTTVFNRRPMNIGVQYYYNVERPDGSAAQQLRFIVVLLYPTAPK
jgi:hypothetical protein